jgi:Lar family restriction alleviation protein
MSELKSCPHCGSANTKVHVYKGEVPDAFVQCHDCSSCGPSGDGEDGAIEAWDRRTQPAPVTSVEVPRLSDDLQRELVQVLKGAVNMGWISDESRSAIEAGLIAKMGATP